MVYKLLISQVTLFFSNLKLENIFKKCYSDKKNNEIFVFHRLLCEYLTYLSGTSSSPGTSSGPGSGSSTNAGSLSTTTTATTSTISTTTTVTTTDDGSGTTEYCESRL